MWHLVYKISVHFNALIVIWKWSDKLTYFLVKRCDFLMASNSVNSNMEELPDPVPKLVVFDLGKYQIFSQIQMLL